MAYVNKDKNRVEVHSVGCELKKLRNSVNAISLELRNRNLTKFSRKKLEEAREACLKNMLFLTAAGLINDLINEDKYNILQGKVSSFKDTDKVQKIVEKLRLELSKEGADINGEFSIIELAKLIDNNPFQYEPPEGATPVDTSKATREGDHIYEIIPSRNIPKVDNDSVVEVIASNGERMIVDKYNKVFYIGEDSSESPSQSERIKKFSFIVSAGKSILEIISSVFSVVWKTIYKICTAIIRAIFKYSKNIVSRSHDREDIVKLIEYKPILA